MPKIVNDLSRFEFARLAAHRIVADDGVAALSRRAVAARLGTSDRTVRRLVHEESPLTSLAAEVVLRRRTARLRLTRDLEPREHALRLLVALLPQDDEQSVDALVWWRLELSRSLLAEARAALDAGAPDLVEQYQLAEHGWSEATAPAPTLAAPSEPRGRDDLGTWLGDGNRLVTATFERAACLLGHDEPGSDPGSDTVVRLRALIHGLTWERLVGALDHETAERVLRAEADRGEPAQTGGPRKPLA